MILKKTYNFSVSDLNQPKIATEEKIDYKDFLLLFCSIKTNYKTFGMIHDDIFLKFQ